MSDFVTLDLSEEDAEHLYGDELEGFKVVSEAIVDRGRWTTQYEIVAQRESDGTFWRGFCNRASTEMQDGSEFYEPVLYQVKLVQTIAYEWKAVKK